MRRFERLTINLAAICGVLVIYGMTETALREKYIGEASFASHDVLLGLTTEIGMFLQIAVSLASVFYVIVHWRSYSPLTATIYLCSTSFFLPIYLQDHFILPQFAAAHAFQYMVFLAYHSLARINRQDDPAPKILPRLNFTTPYLLILVFLLGGLYYMGENDIAVFIESMGNASGLFDLARHLALLLVIGLDMGVTCAHFWYDALIWKMRVPAQRQWVAKRYAFMFQTVP